MITLVALIIFYDFLQFNVTPSMIIKKCLIWCYLMITLVAFNLRISSTFGRETYFAWSFSFLVWFLNLMFLWQRILLWLKFWFLILMSLLMLPDDHISCIQISDFFNFWKSILLWLKFWFLSLMSFLIMPDEHTICI